MRNFCGSKKARGIIRRVVQFHNTEMAGLVHTLFHKYHLATNVVVSVSLSAVGDILEQFNEKRPKLAKSIP